MLICTSCITQWRDAQLYVRFHIIQVDWFCPPTCVRGLHRTHTGQQQDKGSVLHCMIHRHPPDTFMLQQELICLRDSVPALSCFNLLPAKECTTDFLPGAENSALSNIGSNKIASLCVRTHSLMCPLPLTLTALWLSSKIAQPCALFTRPSGTWTTHWPVWGGVFTCRC